ncbi:hypothetical protein JW992_04495 [candidate division KSB1 bacterium]|nr:hypothetical protein [candidate division KSB1 bacterium]
MRKQQIKSIAILLTCSASWLYAAGLSIGSGATFSLGGATLNLPDDWSNGGTFNAGTGTVVFNGASGDQTITNTNGETYGNLTINKASGDVILANPVTVNGTLTLSSGHLQLNGQVITLGTTALLSETAGATVMGSSGYLTTTRAINAPSAANIAGLGAILTSSADLGSTEIRRGHSAYSGDGNTGISRYYDIIPTNNSALNATLAFNYDESELNGCTETELLLFRSSDGGATWTQVGGAIDIDANQATLSGIDAFSRWTLAFANPPILAKIKVLLQGPYTGSAMSTALRTAGVIPTTSPYADARTAAAIPENVIDWILVQLRATADGSAVVQKSFFVKNDGSVVDTDGTTVDLDLPGVDEGSYYLVLRHRNHLAVMSASVQALNSLSASLYDFSTGSDKYYGSGGAVQLATGIWGLSAGDSDGNNAIESADYTTWKTAAQAGSSGYQITDLNLDGQVTTADYVLWYNSQQAGAASQVP